MNTISDRLKKILSYYSLTAAQFAQELGVQKSSISHILSGRNKPSFQFLTKLAKRFPEINLKWFITGEGTMLVEEKFRTDACFEPEAQKKSKNEVLPQNEVSANSIQKKLTVSQTASQEVENIIMVYDNDTFKILKKSIQ